MLQEKVHQRHEGPEEGGGQELPVPHGPRVWRAERDAPDGPRKGDDEVGDHEDVVPVVVVARGDVAPAAAGEGAEEAEGRDELGEGAAAFAGEDVPEADEGESGTWGAKVSWGFGRHYAAREERGGERRGP